MLPSPNKLKGRIILSSNNVKKDKSINEFEAKIFLNAVKIDFEKKGQYPWNTCTMEEPEILKYEDVENKNLTDYCRTIMVRSCPK